MLNIRKSIFLLLLISLFEFLNAQVIKTIYVSIEPQLYILQQIGKYKINVKVILDEKRVRFKYPLKGKMLRDISKSAIYMTVGANFEKDWIKQIKEYNKQYNIKFNIIDSSDGIPKLYKNPQENIYFWLDPIYLREQSLNMYEELVKLKLCVSKTEAKRLIIQNGIKINEKICNNWQTSVEIKKGMIFQKGKRKFVKII